MELNLDLGLESSQEDSWLFKDKGTVCGPVPASELIEKIFAGVVDGETPVSTEFGDWRRLCEVPQFEQPLARALKTKAEEQEKQAKARAARNRVVARVAMLAMAALTFGTTGFFGGRFAAIERPWEDKTDWAKRPPALAMLTPKPVEKGKPAKQAEAEIEAEFFDDEEALTEPDEPAATKGASKGKGGKRKGGKGKGGKGKGGKEGDKDAPADETAVAAASPAADGKMEYNAAGLPRTLTQKQIMKVLATQKGGIVRCLAGEAKKNPDMPGTVTIEFTVQNSGLASGFKVKERAVRTGPLADCLKAKVSACRWPKFYGEVKNITLPFNIKKK